MKLDAINGFWIGEYLPELSQLSIKSFLKHGHPYYLWSYKKYKNLPEGCELKDASEIVSKKIYDIWFDNINNKPKHIYQTFSNYFRYNLIYKYGGFWCDMDFIALKPLIYTDYLFTSISDIKLRKENKHLKKILGNYGNIANGVFKAKKNDDFLIEIIKEINPLAIIGNFPKVFGMWGTVIFSRKIIKYNLLKYKVENIIPYGISFAKKQYDDPDLDFPNGPLIHFYNYLGFKSYKKNSLYDKVRNMYL